MIHVGINFVVVYKIAENTACTFNFIFEHRSSFLFFYRPIYVNL